MGRGLGGPEIESRTKAASPSARSLAISLFQITGKKEGGKERHSSVDSGLGNIGLQTMGPGEPVCPPQKCLEDAPQLLERRQIKVKD